MKNWIQKGDTLTAIAPENIVGGQFVQIGAIFGVAVASAAQGSEVEIQTTGVFALPKDGVEIAQGNPLYWDASGEVLTNVAADGLPQVATATAPAILAAATVEAKLGGAPSVPALFGLKVAIIPGGAAGPLTVTGIKPADTLILVKRYDVDTGNVVDVDDLTSEFSITAADTISNASGTNTTGDKLEIWYAQA
ncbi:hypothetical protein D3C87_655840 [compost metagenome]